ncbi:oxidoreductase [Bacillus horti]|uniref:Uncharacterized protein YbjT (DUF2867 family) n=1 Tax=Caldalkalibacillus horti TaxID=77523 RepID=A0ABT9VX76_9BACI|nr:oxidoreductase [Bacillus horti]MDQ0165595.1 uncharacterized protein YbjT (DUF2867 family) [Bacillus horti]
MHKKSALLLGASGLVGEQLLQLFLNHDKYDRVVILVRRAIEYSHPKLEEVVVDFDRLADYKPLFAVDDIFCCLGTTIKVAGSREAMYQIDVGYPLQAARLAYEMGASQYLIVSSIGANANSRTWYLRMKGELEEALKQVGFSALHIFQPSLLLGDRKEHRPGESFATKLYTLFSFLLIGRLSKYKGIEAKTVAKAMYDRAQQSSSGEYTYQSDQIQQITDTSLI